jgi:predicted ATP-grasp superfamily ATP-dependent carboligase
LIQVFVYEFFTGGGARRLGNGAATKSLLTEAGAMIQAVTDDFCALPGVRVVTTRDARLAALHPAACRVVEVAGTVSAEAERELFVRLAEESDWTVVIAPETAGELRKRARLVEGACLGRGSDSRGDGGHSPPSLLSPGSAVIAVAGDKQLTAEALERAGVPVPRGCVLAAGPRNTVNECAGFRFPAVAKPVDGCGSQGVRLVRGAEEFFFALDAKVAWRVEEFVTGLAASVAVLCGPRGNLALPACEQRLGGDGGFEYLGGRLPLAWELDRRARELALRAVGALPAVVGYVGVDLVLGDAVDGSGDRVIEVNPRLTTSYVGLRRLARGNLAGAMLAVARGEEVELLFRDAEIEFTAAGHVVETQD